jgi:hypothetical protein
MERGGVGGTLAVGIRLQLHAESAGEFLTQHAKINFHAYGGENYDHNHR